MTPPTAKEGVLRYELLLLAVSVLWGSTFAAQEIGMQKGLGPITFNALRFALGTLSLMPVIYWRSKMRSPNSAPETLPIKGSILAGLFLSSASAFQQVGLQYTTCANAGFITGLYIAFVPLIGRFFGHKTPRSLWLGVVVCMVGLYFLSITSSFTMAKGDVLVLICAILWAGQILVIDHVATHGDTIKIAAIQFAVCTVLSTLWALFFETLRMDALVAGAWAVAYAGIMSVGIAFTCQVVCQKRCPPGPAAVIMSLEAVFAGLAGYLVLNQTLTPRALLGCCLILAGLLVVQLPTIVKRRREKDGESSAVPSSSSPHPPQQDPDGCV